MKVNRRYKTNSMVGKKSMAAKYEIFKEDSADLINQQDILKWHRHHRVSAEDQRVDRYMRVVELAVLIPAKLRT